MTVTVKKVKEEKIAFLRLNCTCGKATYIHEGDKVRCSRCGKAVRFAWAIRGHVFMGMKEGLKQ